MCRMSERTEINVYSTDFGVDGAIVPPSALLLRRDDTTESIDSFERPKSFNREEQRSPGAVNY